MIVLWCSLMKLLVIKFNDTEVIRSIIKQFFSHTIFQISIDTKNCTMLTLCPYDIQFLRKGGYDDEKITAFACKP